MNFNNLVCHYSPDGGIDDRIAKKIDNSEYTKDFVGALRGLYDTAAKENGGKYLIDPSIEDNEFTEDQVNKFAKTLIEYKNSLDREHIKDIQDSSKHTGRVFKQLYEIPGWNDGTRNDRINAIATEFAIEVSRRINAAREQGLSLSRADVVNGRKVDGQYYDGQASIFETIFKNFLLKANENQSVIDTANSLLMSYPENFEQYKVGDIVEAEDYEVTEEDIEDYNNTKHQLEEAKRRKQEYITVLSNWGALCTFARMRLRDTEGLKLGLTLEYALPTTPDNFSVDAPESDFYNMEQSVRDAYQHHHDQISSFASLGNEVRRFLSTIPEVDDSGEVITDELGYIKFMDPLTTHNALTDILRGVTSEQEILDILDERKNSPFYGQIYNHLVQEVGKDLEERKQSNNSVLLTQFLRDMHKNFIPFLGMVRIKGGKIVMKVLNQRNNHLQDDFILRLSVGATSSNTGSVYTTKNGKINQIDWENLAKWIQTYDNLFPSSDENKKEIAKLRRDPDFKYKHFWDKELSDDKRIGYLQYLLSALGINNNDEIKEMYLHGKTKKISPYLEKFRETLEGVLKSKGLWDDVYNLLLYSAKRPSASKELDFNTYNNALKNLNKNAERDEVNYDTLLHYTKGRQDNKDRRKQGFLVERLLEVLDVLNEVGELKLERRVKWYDKKGKANSRYSDLTPSYMGDLMEKIQKLAKDPLGKDKLRDFIKDRWGQSSFFYDSKTGRYLNYILRDLVDEHDVILSKNFGIFQLLGSDIGGKVTTFENFTEKDHAFAMLKGYIQRADQLNKSDHPLADYPCFILGDANTQRVFTSKRYTKSEITDGLLDVVRQEIQRMKQVSALVNKFKDLELAKGNEIDNAEAEGTEWITNFSKTGDKFTTLTFLNRNYENGKYWLEVTGLTKAEMDKLTDKQAVKKIEESLNNKNSNNLRNAIEHYMDDAVLGFKDKLSKVGILNKNVDQKTKKVTYTDNTQQQQLNYDRLRFDDNFKDFIDDFYWNTKFATIEQIQLFTVDPAFYDVNYPIKDLQKRYKEIYAPGQGLSLDAIGYDHELCLKRSYQNVVYFDDISVSAKDVNPLFWEALVKNFGEDSDIVKLYSKCTLTDGQGYRTLDSYRDVMGAAAQWSPEMERAYQRIKELRNAGESYSEAGIAEISKLAVVFQPVKPYYFGLEKFFINESDAVLIPVQHKYAEIVLIPEIMKEGKLRDLAEIMQKNQIDMAASTKCVKVGIFGSVDISNRKIAERTEGIQNGTSFDGLSSIISDAYVHQLPWENYRIQMGVPLHLEEEQLVGTQIRKHTLDRIVKDKNYKYLDNIFGEGTKVFIPGVGKVALTGEHFIQLYNSLIMSGFFEAYDGFSKVTSNTEKLSSELIEGVISNSNQSEDNAYAYSIITEGEHKGEFVIPLAEPGLEHDSFSFLTSFFVKMVAKQRMLGGSLVQASPMGLMSAKDDLGLKSYSEVGDLFEMVDPETGDNVLYDELEMPFNRVYTSALGGKVKLKWEDWCNPDGTLKVGSIEDGTAKIVTVEKDGKEEVKKYLSWPVSGRDKYGRPNNRDERGFDKEGYYVPLIEQHYPGILDIVAYRIPTEKEYSMVLGKVFRFTPPIEGGILKVPSSRTRTAGFDFDIDKLQFFMREFAQLDLSDDDIAAVWNGFYESNPEVKKALRAARLAYPEADYFLSRFGELFPNSEDAQEIQKENNRYDPNDEKLDRLWKYWDAAGIEGSVDASGRLYGNPYEEFNRYLTEHKKELGISLFDVYNPNKPPVSGTYNGTTLKGNSRAARNNLILDLMIQRLRDPETFKARYTPGGFENHKRAALIQRILQYAPKEEITEGGKISWQKVNEYADKIKSGEIKDPEPEYAASDPIAILVYNQQNQIADKLIGIFANHNTHHTYCTTLKTFGLRRSISFGDHTQDGLSDFLNLPEGIDVDTNVAELLAAAVDAVKDPVLNFLNLNLTTASAAAMLIRLGYTPNEVGLLFNQPIIREICSIVDNEGITVDEAINNVYYKYSDKIGIKESFSKFKKYNQSDRSLNTDVLANNILNSRDTSMEAMSSAHIESQLKILSLFDNILNASSDMDAFIQATRYTASNAVGSTWGEYFAKEDKTKQFINKYKKVYKQNEYDPRQLIIPDDLLSMDETLLKLSPLDYIAKMKDNPFAFEQCMLDLYRKSAKEIYSKYYPYFTETYQKYRDYMRGLTKYGSLNADLINSLHRDFMSQLLAIPESSKFNGEASTNIFSNKGITNREYYTELFPYIMFILKNNNSSETLRKYSLFHSITPVEKNNSVELIVEGMGGLQKVTSNGITDAWASAYNSKEEVYVPELGRSFSISQLAEDFYYYNFYKMGFNFHPLSSMVLTPTLLKMGLKVMKDLNNEDVSYVERILDFIGYDKVEEKDGKEITTHVESILNRDDKSGRPPFVSDFQMSWIAKNYILNHLDNYNFVTTLRGDNKNTFTKEFSRADGRLREEIYINKGNENIAKIYDLFTIPNENSDVHSFIPIIAIESPTGTIYYIADSQDGSGSFNSSNVNSMKYKLVKPTGNKGERLRYFAKETDYNSYIALEEAKQRQKSNAEENSEQTVIEKLQDIVGEPSQEIDGKRIYDLKAEEMDSWFSEDEWKEMYKIYDSTNTRWINFGEFKNMFTDTRQSEDAFNANKKLLADLYRRYENHDKSLTTPTEDGTEKQIC